MLDKSLYVVWPAAKSVTYVTDKSRSPQQVHDTYISVMYIKEDKLTQHELRRDNSIYILLIKKIRFESYK